MAIAEQSLTQRFQGARRDPALAVLEGLHALKHAFRFGARIDIVCTADRAGLLALASSLAPDLRAFLERKARTVTFDVFATLALHAPETGVISLARRPDAGMGAWLDDGCEHAPIVMLEAPSHHGNIGAVIRVAAAAGATAVVTTGTNDPWHPAAIRGAAGLHYALPVQRLERWTSTRRPLLAIDPEGEDIEAGTIWPKGTVLAFGSERKGLSAELLERADRRLRLPMTPHVSSLNLATSVAAVLYAWRLQIPRTDDSHRHL